MHSGMVEEEEEKKRLGENRKFKRLQGNIEEAEHIRKINIQTEVRSACVSDPYVPQTMEQCREMWKSEKSKCNYAQNPKMWVPVGYTVV